MPTHLEALFDTDDDELTHRWEQLQQQLELQFGRQPGIESVLFLIGVQSRGRGYEPRLGKQTKQDLIMEGTHCVFETLGLYKRVGIDSNGLSLWERDSDVFPKLSLSDQEKLLRVAILSYFDAKNA
jgi:hypothetical protein